MYINVHKYTHLFKAHYLRTSLFNYLFNELFDTLNTVFGFFRKFITHFKINFFFFFIVFTY